MRRVLATQYSRVWLASYSLLPTSTPPLPQQLLQHANASELVILKRAPLPAEGPGRAARCVAFLRRNIRAFGSLPIRSYPPALRLFPSNFFNTRMPQNLSS